MEQIRAIQELVDEHKDAMPTGVAVRLMEECQRAHEAQPAMYRLMWTVVDSHAHIENYAENLACVKLSHQTQTLIVEAVDRWPDGHSRCTFAMPHEGMVSNSWLRYPLPYVLMRGQDSMVIIHSLVPYEPRKKRAHEE